MAPADPLATLVGLPYFILSATGPLLQAWFAGETARVPYRLFSLSNFGSMLALHVARMRSMSFADGVEYVNALKSAPALVRRALELGASALILAHNHPSGDPTPSAADIQMSFPLEAAAARAPLVRQLPKLAHRDAFGHRGPGTHGGSGTGSHPGLTVIARGRRSTCTRGLRSFFP